jgi:hypothetical protein
MLRATARRCRACSPQHRNTRSSRSPRRSRKSPAPRVARASRFMSAVAVARAFRRRSYAVTERCARRAIRISHLRRLPGHRIGGWWPALDSNQRPLACQAFPVERCARSVGSRAKLRQLYGEPGRRARRASVAVTTTTPVSIRATAERSALVALLSALRMRSAPGWRALGSSRLSPSPTLC